MHSCVRARRFAWVFLFVYILSIPGFAAPINWDPASRVPVREQILGCNAFIALADPTVNDSVGVRVSSNKIEDFKAQMREAIRDRGMEFLKGSHLFITGVAMDRKEETRSAYVAALKEIGLGESGIRVRVLYVPTAWLKERAVPMVQRIWERLQYQFPSRELDYQTPLKAEVVSGLLSSAIIEALNVAYLYKELPLLDANLTVSSHVLVLVLYSIYKKFMTNWLLRPGSTKVEIFLKQVSLAFPFVANYNIFGKFSQILTYYQQNGWYATLAQFPEQMANFGATQGLTLFLHTLFYNVVITLGVRGWENSQTGLADADDARTVSNWITTPILAFESVFLAMASSSGHPLTTVGPVDINMGHACVALTALVGSVLWVWPKILDPVLDGYQAIKSFFGRLFPKH